MTALLIFAIGGTASASGLFGPPQTISREAGGLNTSIGYSYQEDKFEDNAQYVFRQNQVYSQVSYGAKNRWEIYGRIGVSDLTISDAFTSNNASTLVTSDSDFTEHWKFFGTLGAKGFLPINKIFGVGAFLQGSYYFEHFKCEVAGTDAGAPFTADLKVRDLWDVNFGIGFQATVPYDIKLYAGPYIYYSEAKANLSANIAGLKFGTQKISLENKSIAGGFAGIDVPLAKGFHLNIEGRYSERFSFGAAIGYKY
ncbi:MAG: hypothetical protein ABFD75_05800 [Smithella sp.]